MSVSRDIIARMFDLRVSPGPMPKLEPFDYADAVVESTIDEQAALVALLRERPGGMSWTQLAGMALEYRSARVARAHLVVDGLFTDEEHAVRLEQARSDLHDWAADGLDFLSILDDRYPARVRDIQEAPPFLFAHGTLWPDDSAVSVVGSRRASDRGVEMAVSISQSLVSMKVSVVAGLAAGIDTAAHEAALDAGGRTVAVIGTGIRKSYPATNSDLQERITHEGLVLSQFWPDAPPQSQNFPMRNAVMSGYGLATVVVEAGERSGARIQARLAVSHGRPVILTDMVVNGTEWGRAMVGRPDVFVASSLGDVTDVVHRLMERPRQLDTALSQIAV